MNVIPIFFLRAKAWQLFLLGTVLMLVYALIPLPDNGSLAGELLTGVVIALFCSFYLTWLWSVGEFLNSLLVRSLQFDKKYFRFALIYTFVHLLVSPFLFAFQNRTLDFLLLFSVVGLAICFVYAMRSVAKAMVAVNTGIPAVYNEYIGISFAIGFWIIGVWGLQPRINRLYADNPSF